MEKQLRNEYTQQGLAIAITIFKYPEEYRLALRVAAIKYLLRFRDREPRQAPLTNAIVKQARSLFDDQIKRSGSISVAREIADIVNNVNPVLGKPFLDRLRMIDHPGVNDNHGGDIERRWIFPPIFVPEKKRMRTVYEDSQNVHNTKINKSVLLASLTLCEKYRGLLDADKAYDMIAEIGAAGFRICR